MKVYLSTYNVEFIIKPCLEHILKVYPDVEVHDFGSEDKTISIIKELGKTPILHGRLNGTDYVKVKEEISCQSKYAFWIDGDEVWPEENLKTIQDYIIKGYNVVNGFWQNLRKEETIQQSERTFRGAVAWNTERYRLHREWPREKLSARIGDAFRAHEEVSNKIDCWCYHGVLLNLSPLPYKKNRWKKRAERMDQFSKFQWYDIPDLPFLYDDPKILEEPKFVWYK